MNKTAGRILSFLMALVVCLCCSAGAFAVDGTEGSAVCETPFENSEWLTCGDYTLHYRRFEPQGEKRGQVMFINGFGMSGVSFSEMIESFVEAGYSCVAVDLPNHGYSTRETADMDFIEREELVAALMAYLSRDSWILAGHSMGGGVAVNVAVMYPERVSDLLLFCPQTSAKLSSPMDAFMRSCLMTKMFDAIISLGSRSPLLMRMVVKGALLDDEYFDSYDYSEIVDPLQIEGTGAGFAVMSSHAMGPDYEKIAQLDMPVLIITGGKDNIADAGKIKSLCDALTNEETVEISDGSHMLIQTRAKQTAQLSLDFLAQQ